MMTPSSISQSTWSGETFGTRIGSSGFVKVVVGGSGGQRTGSADGDAGGGGLFEESAARNRHHEQTSQRKSGCGNQYARITRRAAVSQGFSKVFRSRTRESSASRESSAAPPK